MYGSPPCITSMHMPGPPPMFEGVFDFMLDIFVLLSLGIAKSLGFSLQFPCGSCHLILGLIPDIGLF